MMNADSNIREMSAVLSTFPWSTDFLSKDMDSIVMDEPYSVRSYICGINPHFLMFPIVLQAIDGANRMWCY